VPVPFLGRFSVAIGGPEIAVGIKSKPRSLIGCLVLGPFVSKDAEIVSDLYTLTGAKIDVDDIVPTHLLLKFLARDHHREGLAIRRSESVEIVTYLQRWRRPFGERQHDVSALNGAARALNLRNRHVLLRDDHLQAALVLPDRPHLVKDGCLPFCPIDLVRIFDGANNEEFVAHLSALRRAFVDVDIVTFVEGDPVVRLLPGDDIGVSRNGLACDDTRAVQIARCRSLGTLRDGGCRGCAQDQSGEDKFPTHARAPYRGTLFVKY